MVDGVLREGRGRSKPQNSRRRDKTHNKNASGLTACRKRHWAAAAEFLSGRKTMGFVLGVNLGCTAQNNREPGQFCQLARLGRRAAFGPTIANVDDKCVDRKETLLFTEGKDEGQMNLWTWHR